MLINRMSVMRRESKVMRRDGPYAEIYEPIVDEDAAELGVGTTYAPGRGFENTFVSWK